MEKRKRRFSSAVDGLEYQNIDRPHVQLKKILFTGASHIHIIQFVIYSTNPDCIAVE